MTNIIAKKYSIKRMNKKNVEDLIKDGEIAKELKQIKNNKIIKEIRMKMKFRQS
jgi:hypothetical protein